VQLARSRGIERQPELLVPVERMPRPRQRVVALRGAGAAARDVGGLRDSVVTNGR